LLRRILWKNPFDPNRMKSLSRLTVAAWVVLAGSALCLGGVPQIHAWQALALNQAESGAGTQRPRPLTAATVLKRARDALTRHGSIQARIVEQITIMDRSYRAEGRYLQTALKPGDWHMRLELVAKLGEAEGSLLEVCNGTVLWTRTEIDSGGRRKSSKEAKEVQITRRNVAQILDAARKAGDFSEQTETSLLTSFGLGGMPALLAAIERDMKLGAVKEETLYDRPVYVITGTWTEAVSARMRMPAQPGVLGLLPPHVPDQVRVFIDKETGFPYQFVYLKKMPNRDVLKPMLTLEFLDVAINAPIDRAEFDYEPPEGAQPVELTNTFIEQFAPQGTRASGP